MEYDIDLEGKWKSCLVYSAIVCIKFCSVFKE